MLTLELKDYPDIKKVIQAAFPNYRKKRVFVSTFSEEHGEHINSYWSGGSKEEYAIVELGTLRRKSLPTSTHPYFDVVVAGMANRENQDIQVDHVGNVRLKRLPAGLALVKAGYFCGKPATAHVVVHADNMPRMLPA